MRAYIWLVVGVVILGLLVSQPWQPAVAVSRILPFVGGDISWPQCTKPLPLHMQFGIVGVNRGLANSTNGCAGKEFAWAAQTSGGTSQPIIAAYVNTANPGNLQVPDWPRTGITPYGICSGNDSRSCAFQYGWERAAADIQRAAAYTDPTGIRWWLDVENDASWELNTRNNSAVLEGMAAYMKQSGTLVGVYSSKLEWHQLIGPSPSRQSFLYGVDSWLLGAVDYPSAASLCRQPPLIPGGRVTLTQFVVNDTDFDYACP